MLLPMKAQSYPYQEALIALQREALNQLEKMQHPPHSTLEVFIRQRLERIENALSRLGNEKYGLCTHCQQPVETERLLLLPYAELCLECQRAMEQEGE